ncbi:ABC transporter ATP-binding protein [Geomicrobium sp. JCM 19039]|uniref:ABC transporter ATP-binding protein n=1 Tax=Geomicrobium sp. JCM 19039 TaxID=1460636 RepID=UPI00045F127D|nr:ABC transporter ATP-binding protein [Geomicrobium sp. JCM 19039]GAK14293.1 ABC transporter ATP-binding protein [Geomicrobium sp. JCM 19039]
MLTIENVTKKYGSFTALKELSLEFDTGVYGLLAPNGAGKTTLIKMMATLLFPTSGSIRFDGKDIYGMGATYRDVIGYLPQQFGYYKNDTPTRYLHYIAALKGLDRKKTKVKVEELLETVALTEVAHKKMKKFSGGMIQRVGIAQALLNDPQLLILDEPTAGLDPKERARFRNLLSRLAKERTIILSTHIVADVESIANEIVMIKDRELLYKESIHTLCGRIQGQVYETLVAHEEMDWFRETYAILGERQEQEHVLTRFHTTSRAEPGWEMVSPRLEDVFLTVYQDERQ